MLALMWDLLELKRGAGWRSGVSLSIDHIYVPLHFTSTDGRRAWSMDYLMNFFVLRGVVFVQIVNVLMILFTKDF